MFQFTGFPSIRYGLAYGWQESFLPGFPIQRSMDQGIFAPPHGFSQLITSFFGSQCQGIHPALFFAWPRWYIALYQSLFCVFTLVWSLIRGLLFLGCLDLDIRLSSSSVWSFQGTFFRALGSFLMLRLFYQPSENKISFILWSLVKPVMQTALPCWCGLAAIMVSQVAARSM